jgi:hypothetical protein
MQLWAVRLWFDVNGLRELGALEIALGVLRPWLVGAELGGDGILAFLGICEKRKRQEPETVGSKAG